MKKLEDVRTTNMQDKYLPAYLFGEYLPIFFEPRRISGERLCVGIYVSPNHGDAICHPILTEEKLLCLFSDEMFNMKQTIDANLEHYQQNRAFLSSGFYEGDARNWVSSSIEGAIWQAGMTHSYWGRINAGKTSVVKAQQLLTDNKHLITRFKNSLQTDIGTVSEKRQVDACILLLLENIQAAMWVK